jgi:hypothetical protein
MSTLSPKEFKLFVKTMAEEYKEIEHDYVKQEQEQEQELYDDLKRENQLLKKFVEKLTKENMQLYMKCKQYELDKQPIKEEFKKEESKEGCKEESKEESKELVKLDSAYFKKKLNL